MIVLYVLELLHTFLNPMPTNKQFDEDFVLDQAMQTFWHQGYEATSIQNLVDCTGLHRGSLYGAFTDKHSLFVTTLRRYDDRNRQALLASLESTHPPLEAIRQLFLAFIPQGPTQDAHPGCFLTNTALELAPHDEEVAQIVANAQTQIEKFFLRMLKTGVARGEIDAQLHPPEVARGLLASLLGLAVLSRSRPDKKLLESVVANALRQLG